MTDENRTFPNGKPPRSIAHPAMQQIVQGAEFAAKTARVKLALRSRLSGRSLIEVYINDSVIRLTPPAAERLADAVEDNLYQRIGYGLYNVYGKDTAQPLSIASMTRGDKRGIYLRYDGAEALLEWPHAISFIQKLRQLSGSAMRPGVFLKAFLVEEFDCGSAQAN